MTTTKIDARQGERGNVLFLILIAVALFAALSYAVTQSSRSGGGDANSEKNLVNSSQITQYPSGVRTSVVRMIINGTAVDELLFDTPSDFPGLVTAAKTTQAVFYPSGGGATYGLGTSETTDISAATGSNGVTQPAWVFSSKFQVKNIGITSADNTGNDIIAFLPFLKKSVCTKIDTQLGIALSSGDAPAGDLASVPVAADNMSLVETDGIPSGAPAATIGDTGAAFVGQPFGCLKTADGRYVYYHVLVER